jgi:hypothetical protein
MYNKEKDYDKTIQKATVYLGIALGLDVDEDAFVTIKEMDMPGMIRVARAQNEGDTEKLFRSIFDILPDAIIDHNLYANETTKMSNKDVVDLLNDATMAGTLVVNAFVELLTFTRGKKND